MNTIYLQSKYAELTLSIFLTLTVYATAFPI